MPMRKFPTLRENGPGTEKVAGLLYSSDLMPRKWISFSPIRAHVENGSAMEKETDEMIKKNEPNNG